MRLRPSRGARSRQRPGLAPHTLLLLALALLAAACGEPAGRAPSDLEAVEAPPDFEQLDPVVREQFEELSAERDAAREGGDRQALGAAWGALGQWFDVYGYEESADRCYGNAERLEPEEARWPYYRGRLARDAGRLDEAEEAFRRAAELAPEEPAPRVHLGDLALERQDLDRAEALYGEVLRRAPEDPGALLGSARLALARDRPREAVAGLEPLERAQPDAVQVNYTLGLAWRLLGDDERAEAYLARIPESNGHQVVLDLGSPWDRELQRRDVGARTLTRRAVLLASRGEHDRAAVFLGRAVAADPDGPEKRLNYGLALRRIGRFQPAEEELRRALELAEPGSELARRARLELGRLLADLGHLAAAATQLEAVLEEAPDDLSAHIALGRLRQRQGDLEAAQAHYGAVRGRDEAGFGVRFWHAALLATLGREGQAAEALEADLEGPSPHRTSRLLLARLLAARPEPSPADLERARRLVTRAAQAGPVDVLFAETAAMVAAAEGRLDPARFEEALAWQEAALGPLADLPARTAAHTARRRRVLYRSGEPCRTPWEAGERLVTAPVEAPAEDTFLDGVGASAAGDLPASDPAGAELPEDGPSRFVEVGGAEGPADPLARRDRPTEQDRDQGQGNQGRDRARPAPGSSEPLLVDGAAAAGLVFEHDNGRSGQLYFVEPVGSGGALVDLDGDGDLDVVLIQGRRLDPPGTAAAHSTNGGSNGGSRVFRNDLSRGPDGRPRLAFTDVTEESGLEVTGYGMGIAAGDYDDDGRVDLYFTAFGPNQLWRNIGSRAGEAGRIRFEEVTARAGEGLDDPRWSTSASFADLDGDGRLDLFVTNYVDFRLSNHRPCRSAGGRLDYCGPQSYDGETDRLFMNRGSGTFREVTTRAGLTEAGSGLGVVTDDFDGDGRLDLYVANDLERNFLWKNLGSEGGVPRFENIALEAGAAVSMIGRAQASMGVVAGDLDNDGDDDLFMTHLSADTNTLYVNDGQGNFTDRSAASGLGNPSMAETGFGTVLFDLDNDGWLDVFVANGAVKTIEAQAKAGDPFPLKQPNQLFTNRRGRFTEASREAGPELERLEVSRGVAVGDVDNDGRADLLLTNNDGPVRLLLNRSPSQHPWLGLRLVTAGGRDALGAVAEVTLPDGSRRWRKAATDGSYLSASDPRVLLGLGPGQGAARQVPEVTVRWPDGSVETWTGLAVNRYHRLVAGEGTRESRSAQSATP